MEPKRLEGLFNQNEQAPVIEKLTTSEAVSAYFDYADILLHVDWEGEIPLEYTSEYVAANPQLTQIFVIKGTEGTVIAGAKVTILTQEVKTRLGLDDRIFTQQNGALLEYAAVAEDHRRKGFLKQLTEARIDWAKEHNLAYVVTEIGIGDPVPALAKIQAGFVFINICEPGAGIPEPYFVAVKPVSEQSIGLQNLADESLGEIQTKEILVTEENLAALFESFADGWIGTSSSAVEASGEWTLLLQKRVQEVE